MRIHEVGAYAALLILACAATAHADTQRCTAMAAAPGWGGRTSAVYVDGVRQGYATQLTIQAPAGPPDREHLFDYNTTVGGGEDAVGWVRAVIYRPAGQSDDRVSFEIHAPEVYSTADAMRSGFTDNAKAPTLAVSLRVSLDGRSALTATATLAKPGATPRTSAVNEEVLKVGDIQAGSPDGPQLLEALGKALRVRVETLGPGGKVVAAFDLPHEAVQGALGSRDLLLQGAERKLASGSCTKQ